MKNKLKIQNCTSKNLVLYCGKEEDSEPSSYCYLEKAEIKIFDVKPFWDRIVVNEGSKQGGPIISGEFFVRQIRGLMMILSDGAKQDPVISRDYVKEKLKAILGGGIGFHPSIVKRLDKDEENLFTKKDVDNLFEK